MPRVRLLLVLLGVSGLCLCTGTAARAHVSSQSQTDGGWKCQRLTVARQGPKSVVFHSNLFTIQMVTSVCYNGQAVQSEGTVCNILQQDHFTILISPCSTSDYYYQLDLNPPSDPHSGYYSQASFVISNCFWRYACWESSTFTLGLYVNMNGQYTINDGR